MRGFLDLEAYLGGEFLHPGARATTEVLLPLLKLYPGKLALELGCGTGATAVLVARDLGAQLTVLDRSPAMLAATRARLRQERLIAIVDLVQTDANQPLPFRSAVFDAVYAESVVALLETELIVGECARVLRPGGHLALTERIWRPGVSQALADEVNTVSRRVFGIPAATRYPLDQSDWLQLFQRSGFVNRRAMAVDTLLPATRSRLHWRVRSRRGRRYLIRPQTVWQSLWFKAMGRRYRRLWSHLQSYVFVVQKPDQ